MVVVACRGGTTIISGWLTSGWLIGDWPIGSPSTSGPTSRSIGKWSTIMLPTCI